MLLPTSILTPRINNPFQTYILGPLLPQRFKSLKMLQMETTFIRINYPKVAFSKSRKMSPALFIRARSSPRPREGLLRLLSQPLPSREGTSVRFTSGFILVILVQRQGILYFGKSLPHHFRTLTCQEKKSWSTQLTIIYQSI